MSQNNKPDNTIKTIGIAALGVIAFAVLYNLFLGGRSGFGFSMNYGGRMGHDGMYAGGYGAMNGTDLNSIIASILNIALQLLWILFVIGLVVGAVLLFKKFLFEDKKLNLNFINKITDGYTCPHCNTKLAAEFKFCPNCKASLKDICAKCGKELQVGWVCCPNCGTEKGTAKKGNKKEGE